MLKPHTILLLSALLALCAAGFLTVANHEPKATLAAGYALIGGVTSLALYLSSRQKLAREAESVSASIRKNTRLEDETSQHVSDPSALTNETKADRYEPRYTSHSRA